MPYNDYNDAALTALQSCVGTVYSPVKNDIRLLIYDPLLKNYALVIILLPTANGLITFFSLIF